MCQPPPAVSIADYARRAGEHVFAELNSASAHRSHEDVLEHVTPGPVKLAYQIAGRGGTPVVFVMGFGVPGRAWEEIATLVSQTHRAVWFDNRGIGLSDAPAGPYSMPQLAGDVANLIDHLGFERVHLVGVSMGGMIAQEFALLYPHRLHSLALIATHAGGFRAMLPKRRGLALFRQTSSKDDEVRLKALAHLLYSADFLTADNLPRVNALLQDQFGERVPVSSRRAQLAAILRHRTADRLGALLELPTLIVKPVHDLLVRPEESDRLARLIPYARLVEFQAGHGVIRQCPDRLSHVLTEHFSVGA